MSILRNLLGAFMPHFEQRRSTGSLAAVNAELVHPVNGDNSATIFVNSAGTTLNATYNVQGTIDGTNYFDVLAHPYNPASVGGTIPQPGQPLVSEAVNAVVQRALCVSCGGLQAIRLRLSAYASGTCSVTINTDDCDSISPYLRDQKACTLLVSATGTTGAAVTATLPGAASLRHYLDRVSVLRSLTAVQTASATPTLVTFPNLPGSPALTFGTDGGALGADQERVLDFGGAGMAANNSGSNTLIICPAVANVIWRVNVSYRLGL